MQSNLFAKIAILFFLIALVYSSGCALTSKQEKSRPGISFAALKLRNDMRQLWTEHGVWTHEYIVAAITGAKNKQEAADRLLRNQEDIGKAIESYYNKEAGDKLTKLLKEHILIAVDLIALAKAGDEIKFTETDKKWHTNADAIAAFLSVTNPLWTKKEMTAMMYEHLALTSQEVDACLNDKWVLEVSTYDDVRNQLLIMADMLAEGIIKQYPKKFEL